MLLIKNIQRLILVIGIGICCIVLMGCYDLNKKNEFNDAFNTNKNRKDSLYDVIPTDMESGALHTVGEIIERNPDFENFEKYVKRTAHFDGLAALQEVTMFIPLDSLTVPNDSEQKEVRGTIKGLDVIGTFVVPGRLTKAGLIDILNRKPQPATLQTLNGNTLLLKAKDNSITMVVAGEEYDLEITDQNAVNGVIHGIRQRK